jgi:Bacterial TniB protein
MDSQIWHDYCTAARQVEPAPLTARQWSALSDVERETHITELQRWLANLFVETDELSSIAGKISETVNVNAYSRKGAKHVVALTGKNYVGKSSLVMRWARSLYNERTAGAEVDKSGRPVFHPSRDCEVDLCPVVWIDLPAAAMIKAIPGAILSFFNLPTDGNQADLTRSVMNAARRHQTKVVVVDDVHLLKTNWKGGRDVLDYVKHLNTQLGYIDVTLVLVGANLDDGDLVNDPQIAARLKLHHVSTYEKDSSLDAMRAWQSIVKRLEQQVLPHLPKGKPEMLFTKLAGELWDRTQGYLGDLTELVGGAALAAINDGTYRILLKHLDSVELSQRAKLDYR